MARCPAFSALPATSALTDALVVRLNLMPMGVPAARPYRPGARDGDMPIPGRPGQRYFVGGDWPAGASTVSLRRKTSMPFWAVCCWRANSEVSSVRMWRA